MRFPDHDVMASAGGRLGATLGPGILAILCIWIVYSVLWALLMLTTYGLEMSYTAIMSIGALIAWVEFQAVLYVVGKAGLKSELLVARPLLDRHAGIAIGVGVLSAALAYTIPEPFMGFWEPVMGPEEDVTSLQLFDAWVVALVWFVIGCVIAPITEEVIYRGWLQSALIDSGWGRALSVLVVSILFGAMHPDFFGATASGVLFGALRLHTGNLAAPIVAHAVHNAIVGVIAFIGGGPMAMLDFV